MGCCMCGGFLFMCISSSPSCSLTLILGNVIFAPPITGYLAKTVFGISVLKLDWPDHLEPFAWFSMTHNFGPGVWHIPALHYTA